MKVTFDKQKLLAALTTAASISQVKNTISTVDGLLFECPPNEKFGNYDGENQNVCRISAFDLEKGLRTTVECQIEEEGMYVIQTGKILQIVRALPDGNVTLEIDDKNKVTVTGGQSNFEIMAQNGVDFPTMPKFVGDRVFTLPQHLIRDKIDETVFAVAVNDPRPALNGALFKIKDGELTIVACDGFRVAISRCTIEDGTIPNTEVIIPGKFLIELSKILKDSEDEVTVIIGRKHIIFKIDDLYFFTRMIEADYIDYEKIMPRTYSTEVFVSRKDLISAIDRASIITEDKLGGNAKPPLKLVFHDNMIELSSISQGGSIYEKVPCTMTGNDLTIGFTCRLLIESLKCCPEACDILRIHLISPLIGMSIEPSEGSGFTNAQPNPEVYGESIPQESLPSSDTDTPRFFYLVLPRHL